MATYNDAINAAMDELGSTYAGLVSGLQRCDATTLIGRVYLPRALSGKRVFVARYDGDGRKMTVGTTGAPHLVNVPAASAFILQNIGSAIDGVQLSVAENAAVEGTVIIPLLGDDPYPAVDDQMIRWAVGQSIRAGAAISAVCLYTCLVDAGVTAARANSMFRRGFGRYASIMKDCDLWDELMARRR